MWQTKWPCPWMRRYPVSTASGAQVRSKGFSAPTSPTCTPTMKLTSPSASGGSGSSGSARPCGGSLTAGTTPRASRGSAATVLRGIQCSNPECKADYFRPFSCKVFYPLGGPLHRLCPSCSQKRTLLFGEYMNERLLLLLPARDPGQSSRPDRAQVFRFRP